MNRSTFIDDVNDFYDLSQFCEEAGCYLLEDIYSEDARNEMIDESLVDLARNNSWQDLYNILDRYRDNSGYDFYEYDDYYDEYRPADFDYWKGEVRDWADENDAWEDDEEEEPFEPYDPFEVEEEECTVMDMLSESRGCVQRFTEEELEVLGNGLREANEMIGG